MRGNQYVEREPQGIRAAMPNGAKIHEPVNAKQCEQRAP